MPTENPKISLYVPQAIYDRFNKFKDEQGLSMSQAGIVILAQYFGLEEIIKETTEGITVGGVTLGRVEAIEQELKELKEIVNNLANHGSSIGETKKEVIYNKASQSSLEIINDIPQQILLDNKSLSKRLGIQQSAISNKKSSLSHEHFLQWLQEHDPDGIGWDFKNKISRKGVNYYPIGDTPDELLSRLQEWVKDQD